MYNLSNNTCSVFIPFIRLGVTEEDIRFVFTNKGLGKVMSIDMHEKKIKKNGKLKSANHHYAFIVVKPEKNEIGARFAKNVEDGKTTHVMYDGCNLSLRWEVKPHLSIKQRTDRGFTLLPTTVQLQDEEVESMFEEEEATADDETMFEEEEATADDETTFEEEEDTEEEMPEWMETTLDELKIPWVSFQEEEEDIHAIRNLCNELSIFDTYKERMEILHDYEELNNDIGQIQREVREYNIWSSIEIMNH